MMCIYLFIAIFNLFLHYEKFFFLHIRLNIPIQIKIICL